MTNQLHIRVHGCDGSLWHVYGDQQGREGVFLAADQVKGLFAAPVRTSWKGGARQIGGRMRGQVNEWRDLLLGFHVVAARVQGGDQEDIMGRFAEAFAYRPDPYDHDSRLAYIEVASDKTSRNLDVQLYKNKDFDPPRDPLKRKAANPELPLRAGQPYYYEPEIVTKFELAGGQTSGTGEIPVSNPSPLPMYQKWILTRGDWMIPDVSWEGPPRARRRGVSKLTGRDDRDRMIPMAPIGALQGGAVIELDPNADLMVRDAHGTNLLGQMPVPGMYFEYEIPPHTQKTMLPISVTNAPAGGAMAQLVQPRLYPEPIGGR